MGPDDLRRGRALLGRQLAHFREAAGYTQHGLAPLTYYGRSTIANVETGGQRAPREFWVRCDDLLDTGGVLTARYDELEALAQRLHAQKARRAVPLARSSAQPPFGTADGVGLVTCDTAAYVGLERAIMAAARETSEHAMDAGAWAVSDTTVEQLRDDAARIATEFGQLTPAVAVNETLRVQRLAVTALTRTRRPAQQHDLYFVAAQAAALLASASTDLGLWSSAMQYARAADTYGEVIGHNGVRAYARGMQATVAYWTGRPEEAVRHARVAAALAPQGVARVRAMCVLARAWAHSGAAHEVEAALDAAEQARADEGVDELHDVVGGEFGFATAQQARCASTAWLQVKRPQQAAAAAQTALELTAAHPQHLWSTVVAEAHVDLATCLLLGGDLDAAQESLTPVWDTPTDWRRIGLLGRLRRIQDLLAATQWRQVARARAMASQVQSFAASRPEAPALPPG